MVGALGANLLGYRHPKVTEAVTRAIALGGPSFSLPHTLEVEVAELIQQMIPAAERVRFLKTGSEATAAAVRIARAYTGDHWVCSDGYHGWHDEFTSLTAPALGVPLSDHITTMSFTFDKMMAIIEPVRLDVGDEWRAKVTEWTKRSKVMIFDEIVTAFRMPKFSVARWWGLEPEIICLGKGIANGYPLSVVAGKEEVMNCGEYFISSTFSGEIMSLAAAKATLEYLQQKDPKDLWFYANRFQDKVNEILKPLSIQLDGYGTRAMFPVGEENGALFMQEAMDQGILIGKAWFYSYAHLEGMHEDSVLNILGDVAQKVAAGKVKLRGERPVETFKR